MTMAPPPRADQFLQGAFTAAEIGIGKGDGCLIQLGVVNDPLRPIARQQLGGRGLVGGRVCQARLPWWKHHGDGLMGGRVRCRSRDFRALTGIGRGPCPLHFADLIAREAFLTYAAQQIQFGQANGIVMPLASDHGLQFSPLGAGQGGPPQAVARVCPVCAGVGPELHHLLQEVRVLDWRA